MSTERPPFIVTAADTALRMLLAARRHQLRTLRNAYEQTLEDLNARQVPDDSPDRARLRGWADALESMDLATSEAEGVLSAILEDYRERGLGPRSAPGRGKR